MLEGFIQSCPSSAFYSSAFCIQTSFGSEYVLMILSIKFQLNFMYFFFFFETEFKGFYSPSSYASYRTSNVFIITTLFYKKYLLNIINIINEIKKNFLLLEESSRKIYIHYNLRTKYEYKN